MIDKEQALRNAMMVQLASSSFICCSCNGKNPFPISTAKNPLGNLRCVHCCVCNPTSHHCTEPPPEKVPCQFRRAACRYCVFDGPFDKLKADDYDPSSATQGFVCCACGDSWLFSYLHSDTMRKLLDTVTKHIPIPQSQTNGFTDFSCLKCKSKCCENCLTFDLKTNLTLDYSQLESALASGYFRPAGTLRSHECNMEPIVPDPQLLCPEEHGRENRGLKFHLSDIFKRHKRTVSKPSHFVTELETSRVVPDNEASLAERASVIILRELSLAKLEGRSPDAPSALKRERLKPDDKLLGLVRELTPSPPSLPSRNCLRDHEEFTQAAHAAAYALRQNGTLVGFENQFFQFPALPRALPADLSFDKPLPSLLTDRRSRSYGDCRASSILNQSTDLRPSTSAGTSVPHELYLRSSSGSYISVDSDIGLEITIDCWFSNSTTESVSPKPWLQGEVAAKQVLMKEAPLVTAMAGAIVGDDTAVKGESYVLPPSRPVSTFDPYAMWTFEDGR